MQFKSLFTCWIKACCGYINKSRTLSYKQLPIFGIKVWLITKPFTNLLGWHWPYVRSVLFYLLHALMKRNLLAKLHCLMISNCLEKSCAYKFWHVVSTVVIYKVIFQFIAAKFVSCSSEPKISKYLGWIDSLVPNIESKVSKIFINSMLTDKHSFQNWNKYWR